MPDKPQRALQQSRRRAETADRAEAMMRIERLMETPKKIAITDLEIVIKGLKMDYLICRDRGHAWPRDEDDVVWQTTRFGNKTRIQVCERCTMTKHENLRWDGTVYSRWYTAPIGYYLVGQNDRRLGLKVQLVRREVLRRKFGDAKIVPINIARVSGNRSKTKRQSR